MEITVTIKAPELAASIEKLAAAIERGHLPTIAADAAAPAPEVQAEPEKPKRVRKTATKAPESTQENAGEPELVTPAREKPAESAPEATAAAPTLDQIAAAGAKLLDDDPNAMDGLLALLRDFGVQAITQLKPEQLAEFAARLRELGAEV